MKKLFVISAILFAAISSNFQATAQGKNEIYTYYKSSNPNIELKIGNVKSKYVKYTLKNENGEIINNGKAPVNENFELSIQDLPSGIYNLQINGSSHLFEVK